MNKLNQFSAKALLFTLVLAGCSKSDPAPIICYVQSVTSTSGGSTSITTYTFNDKNKVVTRTSTGGGSTSTTTYTYDAKGNATGAVYSSGSSETYTYDANNRMTSSLYTSGSNVYSNTFTYNSSGQLVGINEVSGSFTEVVTYTYPNTSTKNYSSQSITVSCGPGCTPFVITYSYEYDDKVNPRRFLEPSPSATDNNVTKETNTQDGDVTITTNTYSYNDKGYPTTKTTIYSGSSSGSSTDAVTYNCK